MQKSAGWVNLQIFWHKYNYLVMDDFFVAGHVSISMQSIECHVSLNTSKIKFD